MALIQSSNIGLQSPSRSSGSRVGSRGIGEPLRVRNYPAAGSVGTPPGMDAGSVLLNELALLEWRIERMESAFLRLVKAGIWAMRLYRRVGRVLLRTPFAGLFHRLTGSIAPEKQYRDWLVLHREAHRQPDYPAGSAIAESDGPLISVVMPVFSPNLPG